MREKQALARSQLLRAASGFIPESGFRQRRAYFSVKVQLCEAAGQLLLARGSYRGGEGLSQQLHRSFVKGVTTVLLKSVKIVERALQKSLRRLHTTPHLGMQSL